MSDAEMERNILNEMTRIKMQYRVTLDEAIEIMKLKVMYKMLEQLETMGYA